MSNPNVDGWVTVFTSGTDYEADLVKDRLVDSGLDAVVLTHRDHAFNLNVGKMSVVRVLVSPDQADAAYAVLDAPPVSDEELTNAALSSIPILGESLEGEDGAAGSEESSGDNQDDS